MITNWWSIVDKQNVIGWSRVHISGDNKKGEAIGISDGSFKNKRGTAACIKEANNDITSNTFAQHDTPCNEIDRPPYRSELKGPDHFSLVFFSHFAD